MRGLTWPSVSRRLRWCSRPQALKQQVIGEKEIVDEEIAVRWWCTCRGGTRSMVGNRLEPHQSDLSAASSKLEPRVSEMDHQPCTMSSSSKTGLQAPCAMSLPPFPSGTQFVLAPLTKVREAGIPRASTISGRLSERACGRSACRCATTENRIDVVEPRTPDIRVDECLTGAGNCSLPFSGYG